MSYKAMPALCLPDGKAQFLPFPQTEPTVHSYGPTQASKAGHRLMSSLFLHVFLSLETPSSLPG